MWIFDRLTCRMEGENHIYSSPWKRNINYWMKRVDETCDRIIIEIQELTSRMPLLY